MPKREDAQSSGPVPILLVDDLRENLRALEALLRRDDLTIFRAESGREALELMMHQDFAVALLDVQMPEMSGFQLAELMRGAKRTRDIPIVFVTATAKEDVYRFKGYESGAVDFLPKPIDAQAVKSKVAIFAELYRGRRDLQRQVEILRATQANLQRVQGELERAVQIRDEFMSIASHELKTPLTSLKLQLQLRARLLAKGDLAHFGAERLAQIFGDDHRQVECINRLIDDMLDVSRISSGKLAFEVERFDLSDLLRAVVHRLSDQLSGAGCEIEIDPPPLMVGTWDKFRLEQVFTNLLTNAMRYGAGKPVQVAMTGNDFAVEITVRDYGRGIDPRDHARIFERFERAVSVNEAGGLGLGLYIVKQIVEGHGGQISVTSRPGEGATFTVRLPRTLMATPSGGAA